MGSFLSHFSSRALMPTRVAGDQILPVHATDNVPGLTRLSLCVTFRFDAVLDPEMLHSSLVMVLKLPGWCKLAGRLRSSPSGSLEIHVPATFTQERPAVRFLHTAFDVPISEHPLASQLPSAGDSPAIHQSMEAFRSLCVSPTGPSKPDDWLKHDEAQLSLFVVTFDDATLVSLTWPHTAMDAMGLASLMEAWSSVVTTGTVDDVKECKGTAENPLQAALDENNAEEEHPLLDRRMGLLTIVGFLGRFMLDVFLWNRAIEPRMVFFPAAFVQKLKKQCANEIAAHPAPAGQDVPFISTADALGAFIARLSTFSLPDTRPVTTWLVTDLRKRVPSVLDPAAAYLQNLVVSTTVLIPAAQELRDGPLGLVARRMRHALIEQTPEPQLIWLLRQTLQSPAMPPAFGPSNAAPLLVNHWSNAELMTGTVDFSGAVVKGTGNENEKPGWPVYLHASLLNRGPEVRHGFMILGHDAAGNYWAQGFLPPKIWDRVDEELSRMEESLRSV